MVQIMDKKKFFYSRVVNPDPDWIRIRIGNPDPGSGSRARKLRNFSGKLHFLVIFNKNVTTKKVPGYL
jgi:hypothetical protein